MSDNKHPSTIGDLMRELRDRVSNEFVYNQFAGSDGLDRAFNLKKYFQQHIQPLKHKGT